MAMDIPLMSSSDSEDESEADHLELPSPESPEVGGRYQPFDYHHFIPDASVATISDVTGGCTLDNLSIPDEKQYLD